MQQSHSKRRVEFWTPNRHISEERATHCLQEPRSNRPRLFCCLKEAQTLVGITLNPVYLFAAGHGQPSAQSALAIGCCDHAVRIADDNPELADEYFMAAEILAELACAHANPSDIAKLAGIFTARSPTPTMTGQATGLTGSSELFPLARPSFSARRCAPPPIKLKRYCDNARLVISVSPIAATDE
jgi:hypothetical protein